MFKNLLPRVFGNPLSIIGALTTTVAAGLFLFIFLADLFGIHTNPYLGMVFFLVMPTLFLFGLVLIPIGLIRDRRRRRLTPDAPPFDWPAIDLRNPRTRQVTAMVVGLTCANVLIVSLAGYKGLEYMDSVSFCGQLCHEVMEPEFVAYQNGPHSRVKCVDCHIGEGADWFVRSKLSGTRQIFAVLFNTHGRPVPSPVHDLRPARETCEQCHWPDKFHGDKIEVIRDFAEDEANTMSETTVQLHVGGRSSGGRATGIHWHTNAANQIEYVAVDEKRQQIPYVKLTDMRTGQVREFMVDGTSPSALEQGERRQMDCVDCHNRPTHVFDGTVERAINSAMGSEVVPRDLPFVRREAARLLKASYPSRDAAFSAIRQELEGFYRRDVPNVAAARSGDIERAVSGLQQVYGRNVFPTMGVTWGTHPNNRGHMDSPGCFRCHDGEHKTPTGEVISQDCDLCHTFQ